jgi:pyruvate kinase
MARYRSYVPVIAFSPDPIVANQLALSWGIECFSVPLVQHTDEMVLQLDRAALENELLNEGDPLVIVAGSPPGIRGSTNALRIHNTGDAINRVAPAYGDLAPLEDGDDQE